jgi:hypothetical protein
MKIIQTSNYARKGSDPLSISISATVPKWYNGKRLDVLAPTWQMVEDIIEGKLTQDEYDLAYISLLLKRGLTGQKVLDMLPEECFLLCYESQKDHCHRRLLAEWVEHETEVHIPEWKNVLEIEQQKKQQLLDTLLEF